MKPKVEKNIDREDKIDREMKRFHGEEFKIIREE